MWPFTIALFLTSIVLCLTPSGSIAQETVATPSPTCAILNAEARMITGVAPITPTAAKEVTGQVVVVVSLDANSSVVGAAISKTPTALVNDAALAAARASTFQTRIVDCRPVAGRFLFLVDFTGASAFVAPKAMTDYFLGKWQCSSADHPRIVEDFHTGSEGATLVDISTIADDGKPIQSRAQSFGLRDSMIGISEQNGAQMFRALSAGWKGENLVFAGKSWSEDTGVTIFQRMMFSRLGNSQFIRTIEGASQPGGPWSQSSREQCLR